MHTGWNDAQIRRFTFREGLFRRRGMQPDDAERLADRLATRDAERDERRVCIECSNYQRGGTCFAAQQGRMACHPRAQVLKDVLQRCDHFSYQTP